MNVDMESVNIIVQEQLVRNAKDMVARRQRDFAYYGERLTYAMDYLHAEEQRLESLRYAYLMRTV